MRDREPRLYQTWSEYAKQRQVMISAVIFKAQDWYQWTTGHAKLYGILLWHYETSKQQSFKYSKILKKQGYRRTHNYRLLKTIIGKELLKREGNGHYTIPNSKIKTIEKALSLIKRLDRIKEEEEQKSQNTALSEKIIKRNASKKNAR